MYGGDLVVEVHRDSVRRGRQRSENRGREKTGGSVGIETRGRNRGDAARRDEARLSAGCVGEAGGGKGRTGRSDGEVEGEGVAPRYGGGHGGRAGNRTGRRGNLGLPGAVGEAGTGREAHRSAR